VNSHGTCSGRLSCCRQQRSDFAVYRSAYRVRSHLMRWRSSFEWLARVGIMPTIEPFDLGSMRRDPCEVSVIARVPHIDRQPTREFAGPLNRFGMTYG
jgi:hypothetical protein